MKTEFNFLRFLIFIVFFFEFVSFCVNDNVIKSVDDNRDDMGDSNDNSKDESLDIPVENEVNNITCTRRMNSQMHEIRSASNKQFPFMAAIMSHQNEYLCSGTVVSNGLILTTAQCTQQPIGSVLLNTISDKKDETTVTLHVMKIEKFPTFTGTESLKDVGLVYTEKHNSAIASKIKLSDYTNVRNIVDIEALGFGLNAEVGQTRELQYIGLEHRSVESYEYMKGYFGCIDTKVPTCFRDTGGPVIFNNELMGIVTKGQEDCTKEMSSTYFLNKQMVQVLPTYTFKTWLDEKIKKNEEKEPTVLMTYPVKPAHREILVAGKTTAKPAGKSGVQLKTVSTYTFIINLYTIFIIY